jgi:hypothetical protein
VAVGTVGLVGVGEVGGRRVGGAAGVSWSSRGCSQRPAASRPARATTAIKAADTKRWGFAKAVYLRAHLPPGSDHLRDPGDECTCAANWRPNWSDPELLRSDNRS